ncbi:hypothetical protein V9L05_08395 [Bernardetia sp. Wsw4-3y2]|uniref:hypothetical protein n=1 Tax=Bernardetia sp. Wsw4-3y2 TaxID=3127471 RepID=UPI0030D566D3
MITIKEAEIIQDKYLESLSRMCKQKVVGGYLEEHTFGWTFGYGTPMNAKNILVGGFSRIVINKWTGEAKDLNIHFSEMVKGITIEDKFYEEYPNFRSYLEE